MANNKMDIEGKNYSDIPVWRRYTLTIEEAARYYHIGEGKLRTLIDAHPNEDFYVMNGNRALIMLSRKLNDALSSRLFYAHFDSHRDISHFKSSCFCELFF